jgi:hypothetical protein
MKTYRRHEEEKILAIESWVYLLSIIMFGDWRSDLGLRYRKEAVRCKWIHLEAN